MSEKNCILTQIQKAEAKGDLTRRDMLIKSATGAAGYLFAPTVLGLLAGGGKTTLAEVGGEKVAYVEWFFRGGPLWAMDFAMFSPSGGMMTAEAMNSQAVRTNSFSTEFGAPMWRQSFYNAFTNATTGLNGAARSNTRIATFFGYVEFDIGSSGKYLGSNVAQELNRVSRTNLAGITAGLGGAAELSSIPSMAPVTISSGNPVGSYQGFVNLGGPLTNLTNSVRQAFGRYVSRLSGSQLQQYASMNAADAANMMTVGSERYAQTASNLSQPPVTPDPRTDPVVSSFYGANPTAFDLTLATMALALIRQDTKVASINFSPLAVGEETFDYHNGLNHDATHTAVANTISKFTNTLLAGGIRKVVNRIYADGAAYANNGNIIGDSQTRTVHAVIMTSSSPFDLATPSRGYATTRGETDPNSWAGANNELLMQQAQLATALDFLKGVGASSYLGTEISSLSAFKA